MTPWERAQTALALLTIDPVGLGGIAVRGRVGPARDEFVAAIRNTDPNPTKLHPTMANDTLDGSIDIAATLDAGQIIQHEGLLTRADSLFTLAMAERTPPYLAARLSMALDAGKLRGLIALDEGVDDERLPHTLADRLAFEVLLDDVSLADITSDAAIGMPCALDHVEIPDDLPEQLVILAVQLGINSLRAPTFALRAAKAHAALSGRDRVCTKDVTAAVDLIFAHRATQVPEQEDQSPPEPPEQDETPSGPQQSEDLSIPDDMLLEAVLSAIPEGLLDGPYGSKAKGGKGAGSGQKIVGKRRGRPLPTRDAIAKSGERIDLMATLRAAIPWQTIRKVSQPNRIGPIIRPSDLRSKRYEELSDRVLVFAVDASGSAALARLGEAKGAIELLLGEAYSRRDHVALIAFRGSEAEVLLPPTRSLVQTKRRLASLPGGGGTPLASGLMLALTLSDTSKKRGQTPTLILLTDGRTNVALDGSANRTQAADDARSAAKIIHRSGLDAIVIDTGLRPEKALKDLAAKMNARYVPLPRADAKRLSDVVSSNLSG